VPRSLSRILAGASALALTGIALSGCTQAPTPKTADDCAGVISKVLLTDDSATTVATFSPADVPKVFAIPGTPAPSCYYSSAATSQSPGGVVTIDTHRTLLYIGVSDSDAAALIAALRKTVSVAPWTVRFDYGAAPAPTPSPSASATPPTSTSSSARWYYNFAGGAADDKGQMGYYATMPISAGTATQAGLSKPVNVLRIETELQQVKK
jgi:hypothetical protein